MLSKNAARQKKIARVVSVRFRSFIEVFSKTTRRQNAKADAVLMNLQRFATPLYRNARQSARTVVRSA